jgi:hypothetical protein
MPLEALWFISAADKQCDILAKLLRLKLTSVIFKVLLLTAW